MSRYHDRDQQQAAELVRRVYDCLDADAWGSAAIVVTDALADARAEGRAEADARWKAKIKALIRKFYDGYTVRGDDLRAVLDGER